MLVAGVTLEIEFQCRKPFFGFELKLFFKISVKCDKFALFDRKLVRSAPYFVPNWGIFI